MSGKIAVVGSNMVDLISYVTRMPGRGETIEAPDFRLGCGGKGANQAIAIAKLGGEVMMVTKVGDDVFADNTIANFKHFGVDTRHVEKVPGTSSGVAPIFVEPSGENSILIIKGANAHLLPPDIDRAAGDLKTCDLILMQLEVPLETVYHTIEFAARNGIATILNPAPAAALDPEKVSKVTFLTPNQTELAMLSGMPVNNEDEAIAAAKALVASGVKTVIVTLGSRGALVVEAANVARVAPFAVRPVDTTGAGDAFIGSFARFYVEGRDLIGSLTKAALFAADSTTKPGTQTSYATADEFAELRRRNGV
jgi:ribokinase